MAHDPAQVVAQNFADLNTVYEVQKERQDEAYKCIQELIECSEQLEDAVTAEQQQWEAALTTRDNAEQQLQLQEAEFSGAQQNVRDGRRQLQDLQTAIERLQRQLGQVHERRKQKQATLQYQLTLFSTITSIRFDDTDASAPPPYRGTVLSHGTMRKFEVDPSGQDRVAAVNEVWRVVAGGRGAA